MREEYGLIVYWDVNNGCYIACTSDLLIGKAMGATRGEALAALEEEVKRWEETSRQLYQSPLPSGRQEEQPELPGISLEVEDDSATVDEAPAMPTQDIGPLPRREDSKVAEVFRDNNLAIAVGYYSTVPVIYLDGECDMYSLPGLKRQLREIIESRINRIIVDMTELWYLDAGCLAALLDGHKILRARDGAIILVVAQSSFAYRMLRMSRLNTTMKVHTNLDEARASSG